MTDDSHPHTLPPLKGIEIVPFGAIDSALLAGLSSMLVAAFACQVSVTPPQPLPASAYQPARGQYDASSILNLLRPIVWRKGWKRLGILDVDLFAGSLNFVFGQADLSGASALISLQRLRSSFYGLPGSPPLLADRALKEALHEIGHSLGLIHCKLPCVMYFSNTLTHTDRKSSSFCPSCKSRFQGGTANGNAS